MFSLLEIPVYSRPRAGVGLLVPKRRALAGNPAHLHLVASSCPDPAMAMAWRPEGRSHMGICHKAAWSLRFSMEKAQEGVWLLVISLPYPRQTLPNTCVQWPSRTRDACTNTPFARRYFPAIQVPYSLDRPFSSMAMVDRGRNNWRPLSSVYIALFHPHDDPPILITGMKTCRCSGHPSLSR